MKKLFIACLLFISMLLVWLWFYTKDENVNGIIVYRELSEIAEKERNINYCELLRGATLGDTAQIREFSTMDCFDGESAYTHGEYIVDLIDIIGDDIFISSMRNVGIDDRSHVRSYIYAGLSYGKYSRNAEDNKKLECGDLYSFSKKHAKMIKYFELEDIITMMLKKTNK